MECAFGKVSTRDRQEEVKKRIEQRTRAVAACALAHDDVASLVVDDDADTNFGALSFRHCDIILVLKYVSKKKRG